MLVTGRPLELWGRGAETGIRTPTGSSLRESGHQARRKGRPAVNRPGRAGQLGVGGGHPLVLPVRVGGSAVQNSDEKSEQGGCFLVTWMEGEGSGQAVSFRR